ncbi:MAG: hypothetical protein JMDDDDMK_00838 [Acidobacteria bacterium]|nr:hypothetical protein [Acidobacteriota bacterium]
MRTSHKLAQTMLALFTLLIMASAAFAADPGLAYPATSEVSDQKPGSVLFYNYYTSGATSGATQNTRINITNTNSATSVFVHLFFVAASNCSVADSYICLTGNQTASFLASDVDPGISGYIVAVASDGALGCPASFNFLVGDEYIKTTTGHTANLAAESFSALYRGVLETCNETSSTAALQFDGVSYNRVPRVLALSNIPSRADGNDTLIIVNRFGGNLAIGANTIGNLFGLLYDDAENAFSFSVNSSACQLVGSISSTFPRTVPRVETIIPSGRSGWGKIYSVTSDVGLLGAMINRNENAEASANAFNGGHNLHKLTLSSSNTYTIPIFPPNC